jgi:hypothetical protein
VLSVPLDLFLRSAHTTPSPWGRIPYSAELAKSLIVNTFLFQVAYSCAPCIKVLGDSGQ